MTRLSSVETLTGFVNFLYKGNDSHFMVIRGRKKSGKTDFGLNLMDKAGELGIFKRMGTNIEDLENTPIPFDFITDLETLKEICYEYNKPYLFLFDEMGKSLPKRQSLAKLNVEFLNHLQVIRKYKLSLIGCAIGDNIDRGIMSATHLDGFIERYDKHNKDKGEYYDFVDRERLPLFNIKKTRIGFNEYNVAIFTYKKPFNPEPFLNERDKQIWNWVQGIPLKDMGLGYKKFHRILKEYLTKSFEKQGLSKLTT